MLRIYQFTIEQFIALQFNVLSAEAMFFKM